MKPARLAFVFATFVLPLSSWAQTPGAEARDAVLDLLLFGGESGLDLNSYAPDIAKELAAYQHRYRAYRSSRTKPKEMASEQGMVYVARTGYERRLAAAARDLKRPALAKAYVDRLNPCFEWEGFHECPEAEARFAAEFQKANPENAFREYLPLLIAHRWVCAAEAYEYEQRPDGAERSRREYQAALSEALRSSNLLMRFAAERLRERNTC
jgi:hypothetical protein